MNDNKRRRTKYYVKSEANERDDKMCNMRQVFQPKAHYILTVYCNARGLIKQGNNIHIANHWGKMCDGIDAA